MGAIGEKRDTESSPIEGLRSKTPMKLLKLIVSSNCYGNLVAYSCPS